MSFRVIITGATGMVGEGVLLECLDSPLVTEVLIINRKPFQPEHPKLKECIVPDFMKLEDYSTSLSGYDACFFCAGISSVGMSEAEYTRITYTITLYFAKVLSGVNRQMVFNYVSGSLTDSSEKGRIMWARVKGKTENDLMKLPFRAVYCFRPGFMKASPGQKNIKSYYRWIAGLYPVLRLLLPNMVSTMKEVGRAMIHTAIDGYPKQILEVRDINAIGKL